MYIQVHDFVVSTGIIVPFYYYVPLSTIFLTALSSKSLLSSVKISILPFGFPDIFFRENDILHFQCFCFYALCLYYISITLLDQKKILPIVLISDGLGPVSKVLFHVLLALSEDVPLEMRP